MPPLPATRVFLGLCSSVELSGPVLRDTAGLSQRYPPIARYGVFGVSTLPIGCDTPSPFSEHFPLGEHAKWRCDTPPPPKRGIAAILARYPMKTRQMGAIPPLRYYLERVLRDMGGISHWCNKFAIISVTNFTDMRVVGCGEGGVRQKYPLAPPQRHTLHSRPSHTPHHAPLPQLHHCQRRPLLLSQNTLRKT